MNGKPFPLKILCRLKFTSRRKLKKVELLLRLRRRVRDRKVSIPIK
jgi:hypothetical protein